VRSNARDSGNSEKRPVVVHNYNNQKTKKNCGPWKGGNPKPGFPLFHRPECLRRKEKKSRLHKTLDTPGYKAERSYYRYLKELRILQTNRALRKLKMASHAEVEAEALRIATRDYMQNKPTTSARKEGNAA